MSMLVKTHGEDADSGDENRNYSLRKGKKQNTRDETGRCGKKKARVAMARRFIRLPESCPVLPVDMETCFWAVQF